jgi:serine/threonine protein kinase/tetratricopeptide (TPR) repeat protein
MSSVSQPLNDLLDAGNDDLSSELALVLERYLEDLEQKRSPDVEALLAAHPQHAESLRAYLASINFLYQAGGQHSGPDATTAAGPSRALGDYRMLREVGRGGMGVVYEAEQISLGRRVALKVLPFAAVLDQRQLARFKNEAQAAAQLHHPNIVPVFSVGCERGVHFYAMQYIEGQSLEQMVRELRQRQRFSQSLKLGADLPSTLPGATPVLSQAEPPTEASSAGSTRCGRSTQRQYRVSGEPRSCHAREHYQTVARLGIEAAEALEHAHGIGIVHRDIKPSNLLLDETCKLWITDFGLARFQTDAGLTVSGELVGTVRYMSPEQLRCKPGLVDQRTDIYSLGATLYELATLRAAFPTDNPQELMRQIEGAEPASPRRIDRFIPKDLETIILKAMSKLREDRYTTAADMAADLRRFLAGRPALARRPTRLERACRWAQRHTRLVAASTTMAALLLGSLTIGMLLLARQKDRTERALLEARENFDRAEENLQQACQVVDLFCTRVAGQLADAPGFQPLRQELLNSALGYYRDFIDQAADNAEVHTELARAYFRVGEISEQLSDEAKAIEAYRDARQRFAALATGSSDPTVEADLALCDNNLGLLLARLENAADARAAYSQAIQRQQRLLAQHPALLRVRAELATSYNNLGLLNSQHGQRDEAGKWYEQALSLQQAQVERAPRAMQPRSDLAATYNNLGFLYSASDIERAHQAYRRAVELQRELVEEFDQAHRFKSDLALTLNNLGALESRTGASDAAAESYRAAARLQQRLLQSSPLASGYRRDLAVTHNNLGFLHHRLKRYDDALAAFQQARTILSDLVSDHPQRAGYRSSLGGVHNNIGMVQEALGDATEAIDAYQQAIDEQQQALAAQPGSARYREFLSMHYVNLGRMLRRTESWQPAREVALQRKQLWSGDAQQLYHVACELAQAAGGMEPSSQQACLAEAWQALEESYEAGFKDFERLQTADELALLRRQPHVARQMSVWAENH